MAPDSFPLLAEAMAQVAPERDVIVAAIEALGLPLATSRAPSASTAVTRWDLFLREAQEAGKSGPALELLSRRWGHLGPVNRALHGIGESEPRGGLADLSEPSITVNIGGNVSAPIQIGNANLAYNNADVGALVRWAENVLADILNGSVSVAPAAHDELVAVLEEIAECSTADPDRGRLSRLAASATRILESAASKALGEGMAFVAPRIASMF